MFETLPIEAQDLDELLHLETLAQEYPWSRQQLASCIGGRYFGSRLVSGGQTFGFYLADLIGGSRLCLISASRRLFVVVASAGSCWSTSLGS
ncbi:GNAT family protein [Dongshaea marina]|uniref:hypothetical protein n=1 Tax=Dongshaea marina TaxID=2047966 RepID=UPI000D3EB22C|nr:hypothetical protein [Dongshaea marina]